MVKSLCSKRVVLGVLRWLSYAIIGLAIYGYGAVYVNLSGIQRVSLIVAGLCICIGSMNAYTGLKDSSRWLMRYGYFIVIVGVLLFELATLFG